MLIGDFYKLINQVQKSYPQFCKERQIFNAWWNALQGYDASDVSQSFKRCLESSNFAPKLKDVLLDVKFYGKKTKLKYDALELLATYDAVMQDCPQEFKKWVSRLAPEYISILKWQGIDLETGRKGIE